MIAQVRAVVVVAQAHVVGAVAIALRGTPKAGVVAYAAEVANVAAAARRKSGKAVGVRTVAVFAFIVIPAARGLETSPTRIYLDFILFFYKFTGPLQQRFELRLARQVPTAWAGIQSRVPRVEPAVLPAVGGLVVVAVTVVRSVIQVLGHPGLAAYLHGPVGLAVPWVREGIRKGCARVPALLDGAALVLALRTDLLRGSQPDEGEEGEGCEEVSFNTHLVLLAFLRFFCLDKQIQ